MIVNDACTINMIAFARDFNCAPRGVNYAPKVALKIVSALTKAYSVVIYYL